MSARALIANRWIHQVTGVMLAGIGIVALSRPAPTMSLHCIEDAAVCRLAPIVSKSEVGRQMLAMYFEHDTECRRTI
jgi:hypothetical protein